MLQSSGKGLEPEDWIQDLHMFQEKYPSLNLKEVK